MPTDFVPTLPQLQAYSDKATPGLSFADADNIELRFYPEGSNFAPDQKLIARCGFGGVGVRNAAFLAACVNYVRKVVLPDFQSGAIARRKPAILFDVEAARANDWPWYVVDSLDDDGKHDERAVERDGEWRIYFETASHILAELGIDEPPALEDVLTKGFNEEADAAKIEAARELFGGEDLEIDDHAMVSHGADGTWVSAWVLVPNDDDDAQPDDFAEDDVDPIAKKARHL